MPKLLYITKSKQVQQISFVSASPFVIEDESFILGVYDDSNVLVTSSDIKTFFNSCGIVFVFTKSIFTSIFRFQFLFKIQVFNYYHSIKKT